VCKDLLFLRGVTGGRCGEMNETAFPVFERGGVPGDSFALEELFGDNGGARWSSETAFGPVTDEWLVS
jgi:hypothetical protein